MGGLASRRTTTLAVVIWSQAAGFLVLAVCLTFLPGTLHVGDVGWGAGCGIVGAAALGLLYRGLAIGTMGVVSPITAVLSAVLPILYGLLHQQWPTAIAWLGISCAIIAVIAVAAGPAESAAPARRGVLEAFGAGLLFGIFFIALAQTRADAGLYPLVGARTASFVVFSLAALVLRVPLFPARNAIRLIVAGGVCDMLGNVLYLIAAHIGMLAIVAGAYLAALGWVQALVPVIRPAHA